MRWPQLQIGVKSGQLILWQVLRDQWEKETQALTSIRYRFEEYMATDDDKCKKRKQARTRSWSSDSAQYGLFNKL